MEDASNACPTEILIDLSDFELPSNINYKTTSTASNCKSEIYLNNKENVLFNSEPGSLQSVLDGLPYMMNGECNDFGLNLAIDTSASQCIKSKEVAHDCPTAILVDVPGSSDLSLKKHFSLVNTNLVCEQEKSNECKFEDLEDKVSPNVDVGSMREEDYANYSTKLNKMNNQMHNLRPRWKTPSPKSMSRICKEVSKVIDNLNSSEIFDEDALLTEEMLPIPINFDILDLEDCTEKENISEMKANHENERDDPSINVHAQNVIVSTKIIEEVHDNSDFPGEKNLIALKMNEDSSSVKSSLESNISYTSRNDSKEYDSNSKELFSPELHSDSINSELSNSTASDGIDDVFSVKHISSEDKENIQRKYTNSSEDMKINDKIPCKTSFKSKTKFHGTLRNVSNITHEMNSTKCSSLNVNKNMTTPRQNKVGDQQRRASSLRLTKTKVVQPILGKQQVRKTKSVIESESASKEIPGSHVFLSPKELTQSMKKKFLPTKNVSSNANSVCKSSSSDIKQLPAFTNMKTPSRRYSISTPIKSASAMKPPLTPASRGLNRPFPRYTPQPVGKSRLSLSKSWQHPTGTSDFSNSRSTKQQNYTPAAVAVSTNTCKVSSGKLSIPNQRRQSFSQSMSAASFRSLKKDALSSSNNKFSSKLNLPLPSPIGQDRKFVRALFPSVPKQ